MILTFATPSYHHWLKMLMRSFHKSNPNRKMKVYLMDWTDEEANQYKSSQHFEFARIPGDFFTNTDKFEPLMRLKLSLILFEVLLTKKPVIWTDADSLILKNLNPIYELLNDYDVLVTSRPQKPKDMLKVAAGVMGFSARQKAIDILARAALDSWLYEKGWYSDQHCLYTVLSAEAKVEVLKNALEKLQNDTLVGRLGDLHHPLTDDEHSLHQNENAIILSHHGNGLEDMVKIYDDYMRI